MYIMTRRRFLNSNYLISYQNKQLNSNKSVQYENEHDSNQYERMDQRVQ